MADVDKRKKGTAYRLICLSIFPDFSPAFEQALVTPLLCGADAIMTNLRSAITSLAEPDISSKAIDGMYFIA